MNTASLCEKILAWLKAGKPITQGEALKRFSCMRLGARVYDLRQAGHQIVKSTIEVTNRAGEKCRIAEYTLLTPKQADGSQIDMAEVWGGL